MSSNMPRPYPPDPETLARAYFEEGVRHLEDAHILHEAGRHPAAIASAMKAAEFGVKSVIILDGAMGWWDKIFATHNPLSDIDNPNSPFQYHVVTLAGHSGTLISDVKKMEKLSPGRPGGAYRIEEQQNPEYPFLSYHQDATGSNEFRLSNPSTHFGETDSKRYFNTAQDLLVAVAAQYAMVGGWGMVIPEPL